MKLKKILSLGAAAVMAISLAACGSSTTTTSSTAASSASSASETADSVAEAGSTSGASSTSSGSGEIYIGKDAKAIQKKGTITMVTNAEFEPFEYKDGNKIIGIDPEIAQYIADKLGVKLEITDIDFDSCIPSLKAGKADFCAAGMTDTPEREKNVDFCDPYFDASQTILVKKGSDIKKPSDLNGKVVGVQQGTTGDTYCTNEDGKSDVKVKEVKRYKKHMDAVSDLIAGRIDAVVVDDFPATKLQEKNADKVVKLDDSLTTEKYAFAVQKGSDLKKTLNSIFDEMQSNGELKKIEDKYISAE